MAKSDLIKDATIERLFEKLDTLAKTDTEILQKLAVLETRPHHETPCSTLSALEKKVEEMGDAIREIEYKNVHIDNFDDLVKKQMQQAMGKTLIIASGVFFTGVIGAIITTIVGIYISGVFAK